MFGRVKLDNTVVACDQGNFNQITARGRNRTRVTVVRDKCTTSSVGPLLATRSRPGRRAVVSNLAGITKLFFRGLP